MQKPPVSQPPRTTVWPADTLSAISTIARNIARRYVAPDVAEDIAQDVLLGFLERINGGRLSNHRHICTRW